MDKGIEKPLKNSAFIDAQNLYLGAKADGWIVNHKKFCVYLKEKYKCDEIYYFVGNLRDEHSQMYMELQKAGYILMFREHASSSVSEKKGNVDTDVVFEMMRQYAEEDATRKFVLISGDGDYFKTIQHLKERDRLKKVLLPNRQFASSLYKKLGSEYYDFMQNLQSHLEYKKTKEKGS